MYLENTIENLPNTSSITIKKLKSIEINTYWDLLNYFPFRYENYSIISPISKVQNGEVVTIKGKILKVINLTSKKGLKIQKITVTDDTGKIDAIWYNQPYLFRILRIGTYVSLAGEVKGFFSKKHRIKIDLRKVPEKELINTILKQVKERYPNFYRVLVEDRNKYMAKKLFKLMRNYNKIVAVVGAGHEEEIIEDIKLLRRSN